MVTVVSEFHSVPRVIIFFIMHIIIKFKLFKTVTKSQFTPKLVGDSTEINSHSCQLEFKLEKRGKKTMQVKNR